MRTTPVKGQTLAIHGILLFGGIAAAAVNRPWISAALFLLANVTLLVGVAFRRL